MRLFMEGDGHSIFCACSCEEARNLFDQHKPDVIITDVELLDGSGVDLAHYAKSKGQPRIIGVTGHSQKHLEERGDDVSAFDAFLTKPIELEQLKKIVG